MADAVSLDRGQRRNDREKRKRRPDGREHLGADSEQVGFDEFAPNHQVTSQLTMRGLAAGAENVQGFIVVGSEEVADASLVRGMSPRFVGGGTHAATLFLATRGWSERHSCSDCCIDE